MSYGISFRCHISQRIRIESKNNYKRKMKHDNITLFIQSIFSKSQLEKKDNLSFLESWKRIQLCKIRTNQSSANKLKKIVL